METRIFLEDTPSEIAHKIYEHFELNQSCTVLGLVNVGGEPVAKGFVVCEELRMLDRLDNAGAGNRRKRKILPNSIGGYVAQKIFKYKEIIPENGDVRWFIWRVQ